MSLDHTLEFPSTMAKASERLELVKSQERMFIRPTSMLTASERVKAVTSARSPYFSKMGACLLKINANAESKLNSQLQTTDRERIRLMKRHERTRLDFVCKSWTLNRKRIELLEGTSIAEVQGRSGRRHPNEAGHLPGGPYSCPNSDISAKPAVVISLTG